MQHTISLATHIIHLVTAHPHYTGMQCNMTALVMRLDDFAKPIKPSGCYCAF